MKRVLLSAVEHHWLLGCGLYFVAVIGLFIYCVWSASDTHKEPL